MNGKEVFDLLSKMTEDERKCCEFKWMIDKETFNSSLSIVKSNFTFSLKEDISDEELDKIFDNVTDNMTSDEKAEIARLAHDETFDTYECEQFYEQFIDEYQDNIYKYLLEHLPQEILE